MDAMSKETGECPSSATEDTEYHYCLEVMREGLRERITTERKHHREIVLNKNRVTLGDIPEDASFTTDFVIEKAKALKKKALSIEDYQRLQNALLQSEEHVHSFLKVDNILFALVRDLSGNDPALQLSAAGCCCNLALGDTKACTSLAKSIAPYVITELENLNRPLVETCVWSVGNLVTGSSKAFDILHAQDCLKYIISLMHNCDITILPSVTYAAMHYVHTGFNQISETEMIELVKQIVKRNFSYRDPCFIWLLALVSSVPACNLYLRSIVPHVVDYLYQHIQNNFSAVTEVTASIRILANTVCEPSGEVARLFVENPKYIQLDLQTLLNKLLSHQHIHIRKETLWLIGNLYNHSTNNIQEIMKALMPHLTSLKHAVASMTQPIIQ